MEKNVALLCFLCLLLVGAVELDTSSDAREAGVRKVVTLLQDMKTQLEKEKADDEAVYELLMCWCKTNGEDKSKSVATAEATIADLKASIGEFSGKVEEVKVNIKTVDDKKLKDIEALAQAVALRMKESKEFHAQEMELLSAIASCKDAIIVLSKHHASFVQLQQMAKHLDALQAMRITQTTLSHSKMAMLKAFMQTTTETTADAGSGSLRRMPGFQSYAPASGQILGILKQMQEEFEANLKTAQDDEQKAKEEFAALDLSKKAEISTGEETLAQLTADGAAFREKLANFKAEVVALLEQLRADQMFLANLKVTCDEAEKEYQRRSKGRLEEILAVEDTIKILNSDDSFKSMGKTGSNLLQSGNDNAYEKFLSFVQQSRASHQEIEMRRKAAAALLRAGTPELVLLASSVRLDAFAKVKKAIDDLIAELKVQQAEEVKHKDWCNDEMNKNARETEAGYYKKDQLEAKIADLTKSIEEMVAELKAKEEAIAKTQEEMKKASDTREAENADFQEMVTDARITQSILQKAIDRMEQVYFLQSRKPGAAHITMSGDATNPGNGPARFTKYEKNAGGGGVIGMLNKIFADAEAMETEVMHDEENSQRDYEYFMMDSNEIITAHQKAIATLLEDKAKAENTLETAKSDHTDVMRELEDLAAVLGDLHKSCDFVLKNFSARQAARQAEMEALGEAKAYLSGMQ